MADDTVGTGCELGGSGVARSVVRLGSSLEAIAPQSLSSLTEDEQTLVCKLASADVPLEQIADALMVKPGVIRKLVRSRPGKARIRALKVADRTAEIQQKFGLLEMLPKARKVLSGAMDTGNTKERSQVAQWLHEAVISKPVQKVEHKIQGKLEHDLTPLFQGMAEHLKALKEANQGRMASRVIEATERDVRALPSGDE
jgi:hypothetical protein